MLSLWVSLVLMLMVWRGKYYFSLFGLKHSLRMIRTMYIRTYGHTNIPTSPELCLGTPVLRHKPKALSTDGMPKVTYDWTGLYDTKFLMAIPTSHVYSHLVSLVPTSTHQCLQSFLMSQTSHVHNVLLNGNCMFWALSHQLYGRETSHSSQIHPAQRMVTLSNS